MDKKFSMSDDHIVVTSHSHGVAILALIALIFKTIGHFLTDQAILQLATSYVALMSGIGSIIFMFWQVFKQKKKDKEQ